MDDKKKIVLATEDIIAKGLEDIFININLQQTFKQIKRHRFDNNFDLAEQFRKERNESRGFRVYGIIDSTITDCDSFIIRVFSDSNLTQQIYSTTSSSIGFGDKNVFGKMRGKYIIELNNYTISDDIWIKIEGDGVDYADTIIKQQLVFYGADGEFIEYGTDTVDIGINGEVVIINNDFPFFYNKHWIKNNFQIEEVKTRNISFDKSLYSIDEGDDDVIMISLNNTSVFGNESVTVNLTTPITEEYNTAAPNIDFAVPFSSFPLVFNWAVGEIDKIIPVSALSDFVIEKNIENFSLSLSNPQNATIDSGVVNIQSTNVEIVDLTPKVYTNYNFQKIIRNINPITTANNYPENLGVVPGFEMNLYGAKSGVGIPSETNANFRFFPNDTFELVIKNEGDTTTLPIIPGLTTQGQFFGAGDTITIPVVTKYQNHDNLPKEVAVFDFREENIGGLGGFGGGNYYTDVFYINGLRMGPIDLVADEFVKRIEQTYLQVNMEIPFIISQQFSNVTLTAKHPADNINGFIPQESSGFGGGDYAMQGFDETPDYPNGRVDSITEQIPLEVKLYANANNATSCNYSFVINKTGYKSIPIEASTVAATAAGTNVYLVTPIKDVFGPSLPSGDPNVCDVSTNTMDTDGYYLNGVALLASALFPNTQNATATNEHTSGYLPSFRAAPLVTNVIECNNLIGISKVLS